MARSTLDSLELEMYLHFFTQSSASAPTFVSGPSALRRMVWLPDARSTSSSPSIVTTLYDTLSASSSGCASTTQPFTFFLRPGMVAIDGVFRRGFRRGPAK